MSFLSKLFGSRPSPPTPKQFQLPAPTAERPTETQLIPGALSVRAHAHSLPNAQGTFMTLVTRGLSGVGQREILFTLRTHEGDGVEAQLRDLSVFLTQVHRWASEGKVVDSLGFTQFGPRGLLGQSNNGILYVDAEPLPGIELPHGALAAIVLHASEMALATSGLAVRVLNRRGETSRVFPFPLWTDLHAAPPGVSGESESVLAKVGRGKWPGISVLAESGRVHMTIAPEGRAPLRASLANAGPQQPLAFLTMPSAKANARLVWRPGQQGPAAITPPGSDGARITGVFLLVTGGVERDEVRILEDGHALLLSASSLEAFWSALKQERPFSLPDADGMSFELEWLS